MARHESLEHFIAVAARCGDRDTRIFSKKTGDEVGKRYCPIVCEAPIASWPAFLPEALATAANASSEMIFNFSA
jgi:hypothetical protein